jgi:hypothetical protein
MTDFPPVPPAQPAPMPFRVLVDEAMRYTRRFFRTIYPSVAIPVALLSGLVGVVQALWYGRLAQGEGSPADLAGGCATVAIALVLGLVMGFGYAALHVAAIDVTAGRPVDMKRAWSVPFRPAVLGTSILSGLAVMASFLLCILPGFYVLPLLSFVLPVMLTEERFGTDALSRSSELTKWSPTGRFMDSALVKAFLLLILLIALSYTLSALVALPFQLPMLLDTIRSAAAGEEPSLEKMAKWMWLQVPGQILSALVSVALYLYMSFCTAMLFFDTRGRKEGSDLRTAIDQAFPPSAPPAPPVSPPPGAPF